MLIGRGREDGNGNGYGNGKDISGVDESLAIKDAEEEVRRLEEEN